MAPRRQIGWSTEEILLSDILKQIERLGQVIASGGGGGGTGTVTSVSVATANGFAGTVATATTTPAITISTSVTGLLKGDGTAVSAAVAGTDYLAPSGSGASLSGVWLLASGGAITANNTISGAFNIGFTNTAIGIGVAPASITASTRLDIRGSGTTTALALRIADSANTLRAQVTDSGSWLISNSYQGGESSTTSKVFIRGVGATDATKAISVYNTANTSLFYVTDLGTVSMGAAEHFFSGVTGTASYISTGIGVGATLLIRGFGNSFYLLASNHTHITVTKGWSYSAGSHTGEYRSLAITPTFNVTTGTGIIYGVDYNPTLTSIAGITTHLAFRATTGNILLGDTTKTANTGEKVVVISNASTNATAAQTNGIVLHSKDSSAGSANATLALYTEEAPEATATFTQTHRIRVWWNNVEYWLSLDAV